MLTKIDGKLFKEVYVLLMSDNSFNDNKILVTEQFGTVSDFIKQVDTYSYMIPKLYNGLLLPVNYLSIEMEPYNKFLLKITNHEAVATESKYTKLPHEVAFVTAEVHKINPGKMDLISVKTQIEHLVKGTDGNIEKFFIFLGYAMEPRLTIGIETRDGEMIEAGENIVNNLITLYKVTGAEV